MHTALIDLIHTMEKHMSPKLIMKVLLQKHLGSVSIKQSWVLRGDVNRNPDAFRRIIEMADKYDANLWSMVQPRPEQFCSDSEYKVWNALSEADQEILKSWFEPFN